MSAIFGTDGIRGVFGEPPIDRSTMQQVAAALARRLRVDGGSPRVVLGGDTRASTPTLAGWLEQSLRNAGVEVANAGIVPTPAVAFLVRHLGADAGVAVSASHNPHTDNGIKLFDAAGFKWSVAAETALAADLRGDDVQADEVGPVSDPDPGLAEAYLAALLSEFADDGLEGLHAALDAGNGAAAALAATAFARAGARATVIGNRPDGININVDCGSTSPERVAAETTAAGAQI
ncbi:MAG: phosphoglucosamine mutase, partial [Thermoanaerobaculia bacterium]|nr:phosphoglucosamine mutase [Thermoanaerobaculia bacterium]